MQILSWVQNDRWWLFSSRNWCQQQNSCSRSGSSRRGGTGKPVQLWKLKVEPGIVEFDTSHHNISQRSKYWCFLCSQNQLCPFLILTKGSFWDVLALLEVYTVAADLAPLLGGHIITTYNNGDGNILLTWIVPRCSTTPMAVSLNG